MIKLYNDYKLNFNLNVYEICKILEILNEQIYYAKSCFQISEKLYRQLREKYSDLNNKWYVFARNSLEDNMVSILIKIYNDEKKNNHYIIY